MLLPQFIRQAACELEALYPPGEAQSLARRLAEDLQGVKPYEWVINPSLEASPLLEDGLKRLLAGEPVQYVTGFEVFFGRRFRVAPGVLIPRPETEILVREACVQALRLEQPRVLDLCTSSGCIAWSIALEVPGAQVVGVDLSDEALAVARVQIPVDLHTEGPYEGGLCANQACFAHAPLFVKADILSAFGSASCAWPQGPYDILTANPPYIRESEKALMHRNVLEHEPAMALFVPDDDPLVFCRAIARHAMALLAPGGWGIVEINEALGPQTADVFAAAGLRNVGILDDFLGKQRFVTFNR